MELFKALLPCLPIGARISRPESFSDNTKDPLLPSGPSYYPVEKKHPAITVEEAAEKIVSALQTASQRDASLDAAIKSIVHQAGGWSEYFATKILSTLEVALKAGSEMNAALKEAYDQACEAAKRIEGFAEEHPVATAVFCTVIALGVLVILAPYVLEALGFAELGPVEGSWASTWQSIYGGLTKLEPEPIDLLLQLFLTHDVIQINTSSDMPGSKMQALRFHGQRDIRLEEVDTPACGKGQVKIKPAFVGICGTDLHEYLGGANLIPTSPHPITGEKVPITLGHEFSGVVEEVGEGVSDMKRGDRVVVQPIIYDGTCAACKEGFINCCDKNGFVGLSGWGGGLAEHIVVPRASVFAIPEAVSLEVGALVEPLAVAWHAVNMSPYKKGDSVLVLGGGPIGLAVIQCLKVKGCDNIIVSELAPRRKEFAREFGAHHVLDPTKDIVSRVREICGGQGANVAFDAAGAQAGLDQAILAIRARGTLVNIAVWEKPVALHPNDLVFRERKYMGVATYVEGDFQAVIDAIASGDLKPEAMITSTIALNEVEEKGFKTLVDDKDNHVKILVRMGP